LPWSADIIQKYLTADSNWLTNQYQVSTRVAYKQQQKTAVLFSTLTVQCQVHSTPLALLNTAL